MSQAITETGSAAVAGSRRRWLTIAKVGVALVLLAMLVVALVLLDKPHFGWMVNAWFTPIVASGVFVGSVMLLVAAWKLAEWKNWRGKFLMLWALIGLTSPIFGYLFLLPWAILLATLPVVIWILITISRTAHG